MTLLLGFAAVNTGNNLLYLMVSALLGFMAISGLMGQQNLKKLKVTVLHGQDIFAGLPAQIEVQLENTRKYLPAFLIEVAIGDNSRLFSVLAPGDKQHLTLSLILPQRGYQQLTRIWVKSRFPVNFFIRSSRLPAVDNILVYPMPRPVHHPTGAAATIARRQRDLAQPGQDGELRSIDAYQGRDSYKDIHWKHSARQDDFKVKRYQHQGAPAVTLRLEDFSGPLENQLSQCTFVVEQLLRINNAVGLQLGEQTFVPQTGLQQRNRLLKELALYDLH